MSSDQVVRPLDDPHLGLTPVAFPSPLPEIGTWTRPGSPEQHEDGYGSAIQNLRTFLDHVAAARLTPEVADALAANLAGWTERLAVLAVPESSQDFAKRLDLPGRGQTMSPVLLVTEADRNHVKGTVVFGRYFLGGGGAVHGGAIPLLLDEVLGRLANSFGRPTARTAYLHTNFRAVTPLGVTLSAQGRFVSEEGRKRVLRAELRNGDILCAEAEGLFVELKDGQP